MIASNFIALIRQASVNNQRDPAVTHPRQRDPVLLPLAITDRPIHS